MLGLATGNRGTHTPVGCSPGPGAGVWSLQYLVSLWPLQYLVSRYRGNSDLWSDSSHFHLDSPHTKKKVYYLGRVLERYLVKREYRLHWSGAEHDTCNQLFNSLIPLFSSHLFLPKSSFLTFGFSPKHPIISPVQSQNAVPLHLIICPISLSRNPPHFRKCSRVDSSWWVSHLGHWGWHSPGTVLEGARQAVPSSKPAVWVSVCLCASMCSPGVWWVDGSCDGSGTKQAWNYLGSPHPSLPPSASFLVCTGNFYRITWRWIHLYFD